MKLGSPKFLIALFVLLALIGAAMFGLVVYNLAAGVAPTSTPTPVPPSLTPMATRTPAVQPTDTPVPPTATPRVTATSSALTVTITVGANVRAGPGTVYPVLVGLPAGAVEDVVGRDASGTWYVISVQGLGGKTGWVSAQVATLSGDPADLPVVTAPPTPVATATPVPPTPVPAPVSNHGLVGELSLCTNKDRYYAQVERVCVRELIRNTTSSTITYGILGVSAQNVSGGAGQFQTSWSGDLSICGGCTGPAGGGWEDGLYLNAPGTYVLRLSVCFSTVDVCAGSSGDWETLTTGITVVADPPP